MNSALPLTTVNRQSYNEAPNVRGLSSRDSRLVGKQWLKSRTEQVQNESVSRVLAKLKHDLTRVKHRVITPPQSIATFQVVSDGGDWYNCYTFDGMNAGTSIIKVAKNQDLLCILPTASPAGGAWESKLIRGVTYTYTYAPVNGTTLDGVNVIEYTRSVSGSDMSSETDNVTPCLNCLNDGSSPSGAGDIISAFSTTFAAPATLVGVLWQALTDGRAWAAQP